MKESIVAGREVLDIEPIVTIPAITNLTSLEGSNFQSKLRYPIGIARLFMNRENMNRTHEYCKNRERFEGFGVHDR